MGSWAYRLSQRAITNETAADLVSDRFLLDGNSIGAVGYGVHATLYFLCLSLFWCSRKRDPRTSWLFGTYITINFLLGSVGNAANITDDQHTFVDSRNFATGLTSSGYATRINVVGFVAYTINAWFQDGLLLYRFFVIFGQSYLIALFPAILYLVSIVFSCLMLWEIANPTAGFFSHAGVNFALTFWSISIGTTLFLTSLIVLRLMVMKYQLRKAFGNDATNTHHLSVSATLIESAFLYSAIALIFIVTYARNSPVETLFLPLLGQVQSIAPLLILLRVAQNRAWTRNTLKAPTAGTQLEFVSVGTAMQAETSQMPSSIISRVSEVRLPDSNSADSLPK